MLERITDIDELARAGRLDELTDIPYVPSEDEVIKKEEVFPIWALPSIARNLVEECSRLHKAQELAALSVLAAAGNMPGRGLRLQTWQGLITSPNLFVIAAADSGTGKSRTMSEVLRPVRELEHKRLTEWQCNVEPGLKAESRILNQKAKRLEKKEDSEAEKELEDTEKRLAEITRALHSPTLLVGDVTAEALGSMLSYNGEVLLSASTECARIFQELKGGYSKGQAPRDDLWNASYSLERCTVHRITREPDILEEPCLSVCWLPQPDKLNSLLGCETLVTGGLLARCLLVKCELPPKRDQPGDGMNAAVSNAWEALLLDLETYREEESPCVVRPEPKAIKVLLGYQHEIADRQESDLMDCRPFAARWCENACRVALVLHAIEHGSNAHVQPLVESTAEAGIAVMRWSSAQTLKVLGERRERGRWESKEKLKQALENAGEKRTMNDLRRRNGIDDDTIRALVDAYPKVFKIEKTGSRRPSETVHLLTAS
jgi:hypothetical protein